MARVTYGQKAARALRLLMGLRNPRTAAILAPYGFGHETLEEGWRLLREAAGARLEQVTPVSTNKPLLERLDAWENIWFPVVGAVLTRHAPAVHAALFRNLRPAAGAGVAVVAGALVERLERLRDAAPGSDEAAAWQALAAHGLSEAVLAEARDLLQALQSVAEETTVPTGPTRAERDAAVDALWAWFLQWGQIARAVIDDGRLRQQLGFSARRSGRPPRNPGRALDDLDDPADDPAPADAEPAAEAPPLEAIH